MPGIPPFFLSGGNAKIKVNGVVLAFCTDFSYSVRVAHQQTHVLGLFEPSSVEPLSYKVSGSFTVIRYMNNVKGELEAADYKTPNTTSNNGNGIGAWTPNNSADIGTTLKRIGTIGNDGRVTESFNPSKLQNGTFFDIEIYQKMPSGTASDVKGVANIRNCRITSADFGTSKKSVAMQRFTFEAVYVDEDSFIADFSGQGQQFQ